MDDYEPSTYGERIAEVYDEWYPSGGQLGDPSVAVAFLRELAGPGPALELGIGTGRIALPLVEAGVEVHGIDSSEAMVERLRGKPGGERIPVAIGDFASFTLETRFRLVYVPFNTFFALLTQDEQVSCFRSVANHLLDGGAFAIDAFVPDPTRFDRGQRVGAITVGVDEVHLEVSRHDAVNQRTDSQHIAIGEDGVRFFPVRIRYASIAELDLMARLAGMRLRERWGDWNRSPLTNDSGKHISVWELEG